MTCTTSSEFKINLHAFWQTIRQNLALPVLGLIGFILLIPVTTAGFTDYSIFNASYTGGSFAYRFFPLQIDLILNAAVILYGLTLSVFIFRFMLGKKSSSVYFSLGISRSRQFLLRFSAGALMLILPIAIAMTISLFLNVSAFGLSALMFGSWLHLTLGLILLSLVAFSVTALVCSLTGTPFEGALYSAAVLGAPTLILFSLNGLMKLLLFGNAFGVTEYYNDYGNPVAKGLLSVLQHFNPIQFFLTDTDNYDFCHTLGGKIKAPPPVNHALLTGWFIAFLIITALALYAFKKRRAEIAGSLGENMVMNFIVTFVLAFSGLGIVIYISTQSRLLHNTFISIALGAVVFAAVYAVAEIVLKRSVKPFVKGLVKLPAHLGIAFIVVIILGTGGLGYSTRIPALGDIKSAEMSYLGTPDYITGNQGQGSWNSSYYNKYCYTYTTTDDLKVVEAIHSDLIKAGGAEPSYLADIVVKYNLKDGDAIVRYYNSASAYVLKKMLSLDNTSAVKKSVSDDILGMPVNTSWGTVETPVFKTGKIYLSNSWYTDPTQANLDDAQRSQLLQCITEDVSKQTLDDRYYPENPPLGVIMFTNDTEDKKDFGFNIRNSMVYVTDQFSNTINFLKQNNLYSIFDFSGGFDSIQIQKQSDYPVISGTQYIFNGVGKMPYIFYQRSLYYMSSYSSGGQFNDFYYNDNVLTTTDPAQISQLAPLLRNDYYTDEDGYLAAVKVAGTNNYVYKFLPAGDAPEFVKDAAK